ncbi:hypothetical protein RI367_000038 [Sorochytrium milnesiophthora]
MVGELLDGNVGDDQARLRLAAELGFSLLRDKECLQRQVAEMQTREAALQTQLADALHSRTQLEAQVQRLTHNTRAYAADHEQQLRQLHDTLKTAQADAKAAASRADRCEIELRDMTVAWTEALKQVDAVERSRRASQSAEKDFVAIKMRLQNATNESDIATAENNSLRVMLLETRQQLEEERRRARTELAACKESEKALLYDSVILKRHIREHEAKEFQSTKKILELTRDLDEYARLLKDAQQELQFLEEERGNVQTGDLDHRAHASPTANEDIRMPHFLSELERQIMHSMSTATSPIASPQAAQLSPPSLPSTALEAKTVLGDTMRVLDTRLVDDPAELAAPAPTVLETATNPSQPQQQQQQPSAVMDAIPEQEPPAQLLSQRRGSKSRGRRGSTSSIITGRHRSSSRRSSVSEGSVLGDLADMPPLPKEIPPMRQHINPYPDKEIPANLSLLHWKLLASPHLGGARGYFGDLAKLRERSGDRRTLADNIDSALRRGRRRTLLPPSPDLDSSSGDSSAEETRTKLSPLPQRVTDAIASATARSSGTTQPQQDYTDEQSFTDEGDSSMSDEGEQPFDPLGLFDRAVTSGNIVLRVQAGMSAGSSPNNNNNRGRAAPSVARRRFPTDGLDASSLSGSTASTPPILASPEKSMLKRTLSVDPRSRRPPSYMRQLSSDCIPIPPIPPHLHPRSVTAAMSASLPMHRAVLQGAATSDDNADAPESKLQKILARPRLSLGSIFGVGRTQSLAIPTSPTSPSPPAPQPSSKANPPAAGERRSSLAGMLNALSPSKPRTREPSIDSGQLDIDSDSASPKPSPLPQRPSLSARIGSLLMGKPAAAPAPPPEPTPVPVSASPRLQSRLEQPSDGILVALGPKGDNNNSNNPSSPSLKGTRGLVHMTSRDMRLMIGGND